MITLYILYQIAHYLGDYTHLSTDYMLKAKQEVNVYGIGLHALVHGVLFGLIALVYSQSLITGLIVFILQSILHWDIDTLKSLTNADFPVTKDSTKRPYWYIFGLDQLAHQLVILIMIGITLNW